jgi:thiamine-phosphate pyrophosphorylase
MLRYAITDRAVFHGSLEVLLDRIVDIAGNIDYLQIRERDLPAAELERFAARVMVALKPLAQRPRVLINHRADVAIGCGADGVHLRSAPSGELRSEQIFAMYANAGLPEPAISVSCHSLGEVSTCGNASLILLGPIFEKRLRVPAESQAGRGLAVLRRACALAYPVPVLALGGVTAANQADCLEAGASGVAGIRLFFAE